MPQRRRKVAFSGKKKKQQLQTRKQRKLHGHDEEEDSDDIGGEDAPSQQNVGINYLEEIMAVNKQPGVNHRVNRYNLKFRRETKAEKSKRRALHNEIVRMLPKTELETDFRVFYPIGLSYPTRPPWKADMSKVELDMSENRYFRLFCDNIDKEFSNRELSMYELNLETWRQLWRVSEMSDVLLIIVDARFPVAQFPPYLYDHLVEKENKGIVLVMNKCDLLPPSLILAWEEYFAQNFPKLVVVPFSSIEGRKSHRNLLKMAAESALSLVDACQKLIDNTVNLGLWRKKIEDERDTATRYDGPEVEDTKLLASQNTTPEEYHRFKDGVLTIGTIGHPNVGKSSLINALMGKKVVSVSKTPGHTKHFQTIFLTKNIKLCDCPGLVFPSTVDMPLQVLLGSFPIAQVRDPISVVHYIASRLDIPRILKLKHTEEDLDHSQWTSYLICMAWAEKRGYRTKSRGFPDVSRAANELLRLCLNGHKSLVVYQRPPGYAANKGKFEIDPKIQRIQKIQGFHSNQFEDHSQDEEASDLDVESEEEEKEKADDYVSEDYDHTDVEDDSLPTFQNKFALLPDDD